MKFQEVQVKSRRTNENQRKAKTSHWKFTDIIDNQRVDRMFMNIFENPKNLRRSYQKTSTLTFSLLIETYKKSCSLPPTSAFDAGFYHSLFPRSGVVCLPNFLGAIGSYCIRLSLIQKGYANENEGQKNNMEAHDTLHEFCDSMKMFDNP